MHLYANEADIYVAESAEDAVKAWEEDTGDTYDVEFYGAFGQIPDDKEITLYCEDEPDEPSEKKTASEWASATPRGMLGTTEY